MLRRNGFDPRRRILFHSVNFTFHLELFIKVEKLFQQVIDSVSNDGPQIIMFEHSEKIRASVNVHSLKIEF
jgi:hypothetical protein